MSKHHRHCGLNCIGATLKYKCYSNMLYAGILQFKRTDLFSCIFRTSGSGVTFFYKDYKDKSKVKPTTISGIEFLRRFCLHILPKRFVKIRYYGTKQQAKKSETKVTETRHQRIVRLTGFDYHPCQVCKMGFMHTIELLPKIRVLTNVLYPARVLSY